MRLPTAEEINPFPEDIDGQCAERHFCGKTLEEAEALFRESSLTHQEDLMFMGPTTFRFYVQAAISYIQSEAATGDPDIINCLAGILEQRLFHPIIAEFVSEDMERIRARQRMIAEREWNRTEELGRGYLARWPGRARDGRPVFASRPAPAVSG